MSGRGRGVSNAPAWMSRGEHSNRNGGAPEGSIKRPRSRSPERDAYGRVRGPRDRGGPPRGAPPPYHGRGPPPHHRRGPPHRYDDRRGGPHHRGRGGHPRGDKSGIVFNSYDEERAWLEERRRKRLSRKSKFDVPPTAEQLAIDATAAAMTNFAATDFSGVSFGGAAAASQQPQQTRHARRLYIGHLPPDVTEEQLHVFFRQAINSALVQKVNDDPILSVYINHERRFCFLEFKTVEMTTACLALDGIDVMGRGKVKVKRPNDYNPSMAPNIHPSAVPQLDVSRLGIVSGTVPDGPNKIFIGGLHYHLNEEQVIELLQAFGQVKAFHLVKDDPDSLTSKGYCFVEYTDPNVTPVAVMGLNGMDLGGGKTLTARVAAARHAMQAAVLSGPSAGIPSPMAATGTVSSPAAAAAAGRNIVNGYDVEQLVDAAMGLCPMPAPPTMDPMTGIPGAPMGVMSPAVGAPMMTGAPMMAAPMTAPVAAQPPVMQQQPLAPSSALHIANAAIEAAFGPEASQAPPPPQQQQTRILVLLNMVTNKDLATDQDYQGLSDEVREECSKYGRLVSMKIPRPQDGHEPSAVKKIFLEYATIQEAAKAEGELAGRTFGPNVVQSSYFSEEDYQAGRLR